MYLFLFAARVCSWHSATVEGVENLAFRLLQEQAELDIAYSRTASSKELRTGLSQLVKTDEKLMHADG